MMNTPKPTIAELEAIMDSNEKNIEIGPDGSLSTSQFRNELTSLINCHSKENGSDTPDFALAKFLEFSLYAFDIAVLEREKFFGRKCGNGQSILANEIKEI